MVLAFCSKRVLCSVELSLHGEAGRLTEPIGPMLWGGGLSRQVDGEEIIGREGLGAMSLGGKSIRHLLLGCREGEMLGGLRMGGFAPLPLARGSEMLRLKLNLRLSLLRLVEGGSLSMFFPLRQLECLRLMLRGSTMLLRLLGEATGGVTLTTTLQR